MEMDMSSSMTRRRLMKHSCSIVMLLNSYSALGASARAQASVRDEMRSIGGRDLDPVPPLPPDLRVNTGIDDINNTLNVEQLSAGRLRPLPEEVKEADNIIDACPTATTPIAVAVFLREVALGKKNQEWMQYGRAWPERANPLIVRFFDATDTIPQGDVTAWCAAFVNWCMIHSRRNRPGADAFAMPTMSAASGSFRTWGRGIEFQKGGPEPTGFVPRPGDLVVFELMVGGVPDPTRGHVGFFVSRDAGNIVVLGGNQFEGRPLVHAICQKSIPMWGETLQIHSIRTDPSLH
jgi:hypothetical protein